MEKLDIAMAFLRCSQPKKSCTIGIAIPPPPIPPTLLRSMINENKNVPGHSIGKRGHKGL